MQRVRKSRFAPLILLLPAGIFYALVFFASLITMLVISFYEYSPVPGILYNLTFTLVNYQKFLEPAYANILIVTLRIGLISSVVSLILGYPIAYFTARSKSSRTRSIFLSLTVIMLFVFGIVRVHGWLILLSKYGLLNSLITSIGMSRSELLYTETAVILGSSSFIMPFAILSLVASIKNIDPCLEDAARSLGANDVRAFLKVTLPLSLPGIVSAALLCFTLGVSMFMTPIVLGGGKVTMMSNLIFDKISFASNYPVSSAAAVVLLLISVAISYGINRPLQRVLGEANEGK